MSIKEELNARARFKMFQLVRWQGKRYKVWHRYWRRSEDAFYYDLMEQGVSGFAPKILRKVPDHDLEPA